MGFLRKLISNVNNTSSFDCEQFCLVACDKLCSLLCPDFCYDPSEISPPPPPISGDDGSPTKSTQLLLIIVFTVLGGSFLVLCFLAFYFRFYRNGFNGRSISRPQTTEIRDDFLDEDHGPIIDHPIWYINTVGLQPSIIDSIAVCKYKKGEGLVEGTACSVCLNDFKEYETLRVLPKCNHAFHMSCIDTWLRSHTNCPMCRAPVVSSTEGRIDEVNTRNFGVTSEVVNEEQHGGTSEVRVVVEEEKIEYRR